MSDKDYIKTLETDNDKLRAKVVELEKLVERYEALEKGRYITDDKRQRELAAGKAWRDQVLKDLTSVQPMPDNKALKSYWKKRMTKDDMEEDMEDE